MSKLLVVEDDRTLLDVLETFLTGKGFEVKCAGDGDEALEIFSGWQADLVITDILMPRKEGFETIRDLKRESADIKIIAMTGGGRNDPKTYLDFAGVFGADRALAKPFELRVLLELVEDLLGPCDEPVTVNSE